MEFDAEEFDAFYARSRDRLAVQLAALTGDPAEALDHVQEAFVRAWLRWRHVAELDDPEAWVRRVARNLAVSRWRRARRLVLRARPPDAPIPFDEEQGHVLTALAGLPPVQREAVVLHHVVGLSVAEVATEMRAPVGTVKSWLSRGRHALAAALTEVPVSASKELPT